MSAGGKCARCGWPATRVARFNVGTPKQPTIMVEELCAAHGAQVKKLHGRKVKITRLLPKENARG